MEVMNNHGSHFVYSIHNSRDYGLEDLVVHADIEKTFVHAYTVAMKSLKFIL